MGQVINFGCRLNACESEAISQFVDELGIVDYTIINTCAVTAEAERQLRQEIRKLYKQNPDIKLILTGCAAELNPDLYLGMDGVVGIISNKVKLSKEEYLKYGSREKSVAQSNNQKVRGFVQIQNGCDHRCTYCVVRLTRGPSVSFDKDEIIFQAREALKQGHKELVLTGVNISSYGQDLSPQTNISFIIRYLLKNVPELTRLRLSSLDPADINDEFIELIAGEERLMPHIHESIQSGDNMILKRMGRRHNREQVIETNLKILEKRSEVIFGADIIAGFPTETDDMFENTRKLLTEGNLSLLHVFPYSKRPGTPAALMPQVLKKTATARAKILRGEASEILNHRLQAIVGQKVHILAETSEIAKTDSFLPVKSLSELEAGKEYWINCVKIENNTIMGEL
ncbi:MAG: tRNA (N(6)-L-threonylcarbamoyladenosine(37)-C(2))-methylthiotransferase MtaB [Alphaproteobacteria bacterium]|nr:tRNA (N(6)-L-threonylcarbamoyladenosine(37)-C(2))-methylthiotransferase MtaB [Alphaproteobacteria bacterium]